MTSVMEKNKAGLQSPQNCPIEEKGVLCLRVETLRSTLSSIRPCKPPVKLDSLNS